MIIYKCIIIYIGVERKDIMKKIGKFIVKARYALLAIFIGLVVISGILMTKVKINYDMTRYLDKDSTSSLSLEVMQDEFGSVGHCQVMVYRKKLTFDETIRILTWKRDIYPMWVDIYIENNTKVYLYFSRRFRKYSEVCMCKNRSIPPFRIIKEKMCITSNPPFERT